MQITNAASSIITKLLNKQRCKLCSSKLKFNTKYAIFLLGVRAAFYHLPMLWCWIPMRPKWNKKNVRVFPPCEFLLKSAYLHCKHIHTALMGNLNATSAPLLFKIPMHQRRNVSAITTKATVQTHPQPTCSSLSAALASSPARVSRRCLTGPSTDNTWASSHRDGYSWWTHNTHTFSESSNNTMKTHPPTLKTG